ncbi:MAG: CAP domain-containing protein [Desulfobacterota bacterium]|nr:CAP domain-containing protein [Thermodesulfobacteriota bacterium]
MRERLDAMVIGLCLLLLCPFMGYAEEGVTKGICFRALEEDLFRELNRVRSAPKTYAFHLKEMRPFYHGKELRRPGQTPLLTQEGVNALIEAIHFMERASPVPTLRWSTGLSRGAKDHVEEQGRTAAVGHGTAEGSRPHERIARYGVWQKKMGENIAYGCRGGQEAIVTFLIDDGVPGRTHRRILLDRDFRAVGIACGPHPVYETVCVLIFAAEYHEKGDEP